MAIFLSKSARRSLGTCLEPPVDVYRTPCGWTIKVELAGVALGDITVELNGTALTVRGVRRDWIMEQGWQHHSMEISYCHFRRDIELPAGARGGLISSEYRPGMLLIHVAMEGSDL